MKRRWLRGESWWRSAGSGFFAAAGFADEQGGSEIGGDATNLATQLGDGGAGAGQQRAGRIASEAISGVAARSAEEKFGTRFSSDMTKSSAVEGVVSRGLGGLNWDQGAAQEKRGWRLPSSLELLTCAVTLRYRLGAVGVEGAGEFLGDGGGGGVLDGRALHEVDELAVAEDGDGGRGGGMALEVAAGALGGLAILAGEDGDGLVGLGGVLEGETDAGAHLAGGATADGVHDEHGGSGRWRVRRPPRHWCGLRERRPWSTLRASG